MNNFLSLEVVIGEHGDNCYLGISVVGVELFE